MLTLHRLSSGYRVLYGAVLVVMTAGTAAHTAHQAVRAGLTPGAVAAWYRGNEADADAAVLLFPRSFEEVLGDVWTALTTYTLALLIFGAILARADAGARLRAALVVGYAVGGLCAAAAPLLVRYAAPGFAWLETLALLGLPLLALAMTALVLRDLSRPGPRLDPGRRV